MESEKVVEAVAAAMKPELFSKPESECGPVTMYEREFCLGMAWRGIAAFIEAVREPTPEMVRAAQEAVSGPSLRPDVAAGIFAAMLDALMEGK